MPFRINESKVQITILTAAAAIDFSKFAFNLAFLNVWRKENAPNGQTISQTTYTIFFSTIEVSQINTVINLAHEANSTELRRVEHSL